MKKLLVALYFLLFVAFVRFDNYKKSVMGRQKKKTISSPEDYRNKGWL